MKDWQYTACSETSYMAKINQANRIQTRKPAQQDGLPNKSVVPLRCSQPRQQQQTAFPKSDSWSTKLALQDG